MLVEIMKINKEDVVVVTSLDIAEIFGKRHDNVLNCNEFKLGTQ